MKNQVKAQWQTTKLEYPNPTYNCTYTGIVLGVAPSAGYFHLDGGFKVERYRKNAKVYATEREVREVLLKTLLAATRYSERLILAELSKNGETK